MFKKNITDLIKLRISRRTYKKENIKNDIKIKLTNFLKLNHKSPFNSQMRFKLLDSSGLNLGNKIGTYGFIKEAKTFIIGAVKNSENNLEDYGFMLEKIILYCTELNLGTCWLGASFKRTQIADEINLKENEIIPGITPVGYVDQKNTIRERLFAGGIGARNRKSWNKIFFHNNFETPLNESLAEIYKIPLDMLRLAPSASNKQPWRIIKKEKTFHFFLEESKLYQMILEYNLQRVDMGIAMCHFELTANQLGLKGKWKKENQALDINNKKSNIKYIASWVSES